MPTIEIADDKKYTKAIGMLLDMGGMFWTRPTRRLVVGPGQIQVLQRAGLLPKDNGAKKNGKSKAT